MAEETKSTGKLPEGIAKRLKDLVQDLEREEGKEPKASSLPRGKIDITINEDEALWYVAYGTSS